MKPDVVEDGRGTRRRMNFLSAFFFVSIFVPFFLGPDQTNNVGNCEPRCFRFTANVSLFLLWILGNGILQKFARTIICHQVRAIALCIIFLANFLYMLRINLALSLSVPHISLDIIY